MSIRTINKLHTRLLFWCVNVIKSIFIMQIIWILFLTGYLGQRIGANQTYQPSISYFFSKEEVLIFNSQIFESTFLKTTNRRQINKQCGIKLLFKVNWYEANGRCAAMGMHLVSIMSKEENDFIAKQIDGEAIGKAIQVYILL